MDHGHDARDTRKSGTGRAQGWFTTFSIGLVSAWRVRLLLPVRSELEQYQGIGNLSCTAAGLQGAIAREEEPIAVGGLSKVFAAITA